MKILGFFLFVIGVVLSVLSYSTSKKQLSGTVPSKSKRIIMSIGGFLIMIASYFLIDGI
jgi:hypothetical protein